MAEEEVWKCRKHPLKRRSNGVCPLCLRDRLLHLCPDCANARPCSCCYSSSSSSSSSFSLSSSFDAPKSSAGIGVRTVGSVSNLIDCDPAFRRSRSNTFTFIRRRPSDKDAVQLIPPDVSRTRSSLWPVFKSSTKSKKADEIKEEKENLEIEKVNMMRSKSVGISSLSESAGADGKLKGRRWHFPSPMKVFRQPKPTKVVQELPPLCRG
ncbi:uncharacterized protein LOC122063493 [Macadamia integrifolia]|uniref:uncharacterized protein LOC122063493 n=1 Tax=Macadamia integrifolia TaxID=60698 RepID=UPI001C4F3777|nr:uncharacterized protein LOC122063493 [Macadamia integrifolia]